MDEAEQLPDAGEQQDRLNRLAPGGYTADAEAASEASLPVTVAVEAASDEDEALSEEEGEGEFESVVGESGAVVRAVPGSSGQNGGGLGSRRTSGAFSEASSGGAAALPDSWEALGEEAHEADLSGAQGLAIHHFHLSQCSCAGKCSCMLKC